jgi:cell wall assembly regulator SMI1
MLEREVRNLRRYLDAIAASGGDARPLEIAERANEAGIVVVEGELGLRLPSAFRRLLKDFAGAFDYSWFAAGDAGYPEPFRSNFSGALSWSLKRLVEIDEGRRNWVKHCFPNPDVPNDRIWHDKLAFAEVGNGDYLALDLSPERHGRVVYLSHDDGEGHGFAMANDIVDLIQRWSVLGCTGAEDWQWLPFTSNAESGIDQRCENAIRWRALILGAPADMDRR